MQREHVSSVRSWHARDLSHSEPASPSHDIPAGTMSRRRLRPSLGGYATSPTAYSIGVNRSANQVNRSTIDGPMAGRKFSLSLTNWSRTYKRHSTNLTSKNKKRRQATFLSETISRRVAGGSYHLLLRTSQASPPPGLLGGVSSSHWKASSGVSKTFTFIPRFTATVSPNLRGSRRGSFITYANRGPRGIRYSAISLLRGQEKGTFYFFDNA